MNRLHAAAIAALAAAFAAPSAQASDVKTLEACVAENRGSPNACIGLLAEPCLEATQQTTLDIVECATREAASWDLLLNRWYRDLSAGSDKDAGRRLRDAQRAWIIFRDADCAFAYAQWADGSMRTVAGAYCQRDRTATRAIELHGYLNPGG